MSFSTALRSEIVERITGLDFDPLRVRSLIATISGRRIDTTMAIETRHAGYANWLRALFSEAIYTEGPVQRFVLPTLVSPDAAYAWLAKMNEEDFGVILALLFLAGGSMSEPKRTNQLAYRVRGQALAGMIVSASRQRGLTLHVLAEKNSVRLYSKNGDDIGDILILSGATNAYLAFSELRVDKEVFNRVNRQVNCDRANAGRVASSSRAQIEAIRLLERAVGLDNLPEPLALAARARLEYQDYSLTDLGQMVAPPVSKSGMNHRMKKLLQLAEELTS